MPFATLQVWFVLRLNYVTYCKLVTILSEKQCSLIAYLNINYRCALKLIVSSLSRSRVNSLSLEIVGWFDARCLMLDVRSYTISNSTQQANSGATITGDRAREEKNNTRNLNAKSVLAAVASKSIITAAAQLPKPLTFVCARVKQYLLRVTLTEMGTNFLGIKKKFARFQKYPNFITRHFPFSIRRFLLFHSGNCLYLLPPPFLGHLISFCSSSSSFSS